MEQNRNEDGDEPNQRMRSATRGLHLILVGRLRQKAFINQPRSWVTSDQLDPRNGVTITVRKLYELADRPIESGIIPEADEEITVPRLSIHVAEARAMMAMVMLANAGEMYAGYTDDELELLPDGGAQVRFARDPHTKPSQSPPHIAVAKPRAAVLSASGAANCSDHQRRCRPLF